jgi:predicted DNA-binding transcriptional regulator YafY
MDILRHGGHVSVVAPTSLRALVRKRLEEGLSMNAV